MGKGSTGVTGQEGGFFTTSATWEVLSSAEWTSMEPFESPETDQRIRVAFQIEEER